MMKRAISLLFLVLVAALPAKAEVGDDGLHKEDWFTITFRDIADDIAQAKSQGKRLAIVIEQRGCIYCREMHEKLLSDPEVRDYIKDMAQLWLNEYHADGLRWDGTKWVRTTSGDGSDELGGAGTNMLKWINDTIARQVLEGVLAGEGSPEQVVTARGLEVVSDDGALGAAVDRAIEANPDVAEKIRAGKVAAAGALIGAVMKEMRGQADAGRVRELVLERLT